MFGDFGINSKEYRTIREKANNRQLRIHLRHNKRPLQIQNIQESLNRHHQEENRGKRSLRTRDDKNDRRI